jgi:hypothetical protein
MNWKRWAVMASSLASSHKAVAAAVSGAATALVLSPLVEAVLPFVAGFAGAVAVYAWTEPQTAKRAIGSAVVSVALGGVAGPAAMDVAGFYLGLPYSLATLLLVSFICAATWPMTAPFVWSRVKALAVAFTPKQGNDDGRA